VNILLNAQGLALAVILILFTSVLAYPAQYADADDVTIKEECTSEGWLITIIDPEGNPLKNVRVMTLKKMSSSSPEESFFTDEMGMALVPFSSITGFVKLSKGGYNDHKLSISCTSPFPDPHSEKTEEYVGERSYSFTPEYYSDTSQNTKADYYFQQGFSALYFGEYKKAIPFFDQALNHDPNFIGALMNKGSALGELGRYHEAIQSFDKVLEIDPNNAFALNNKGFALMNLGNFEDAISSYKRAIEINPGYLDALYNAADALREQWYCEDAIYYYGQIIQINPNDPYPYYNMANQLSGLGLVEESIAILDLVLAMDPNYMMNIGSFVVLIDEDDWSESMWTNILQKYPNVWDGVSRNSVNFTVVPMDKAELDTVCIKDSIIDRPTAIFETTSDAAIMPEIISGKYVNSEVGVEMEFPQNWAGFAITFPKDIDYSEMPAELQGMMELYSGMTLVTMSPTEFDPVENVEMMMLTTMETSSVDSFSEFISQAVESAASQSSSETQDLGIESLPECDISNQTILEINEMKTIQINSVCQDPIQNMAITMSTYVFMTPQYVISPMYMTTHEIDGNSDLSLFENSLNTLKIENTIDISDPYSYAELFGLKITKEKIMIDNKSHEIKIVSDSTITDFSFDETNQTILFESKGESKLASTEVYFDNVLMAPFTVTIDGVAEDAFMITEDQTTGQTSISISYIHPVEKISIKGNKSSTMPNNSIPDWIKNNAKWWVDGTIDDKAFVGGIQFLIKEGIIQIPETTTSTTDGSQEIPAWIKNNADWWGRGLISDDDFLKGIQFMVENGIIIV